MRASLCAASRPMKPVRRPRSRRRSNESRVALEFPIEFFEGDELVADLRRRREFPLSGAYDRFPAPCCSSPPAPWPSRYTTGSPSAFDCLSQDVPRIQPGTDPETAAEIVRQEWGLGTKPIPNLLHLMEAKGVRVFSLAQECREVDAFSLWRKQPFVFLNTQKSAEHSRFDAAHELGHLVMHWHHELPQGKQVEREANDFAGALLMPASGILANVPRNPTLPQLLRLKPTLEGFRRGARLPPARSHCSQ